MPQARAESRRPSTMAAAFTRALAAAGGTPADQAAVALARRLAKEIDADGDLVRLAPQYLAVLTALGMTPASRGSAAKGVADASPAVDALAELRKRRAGTA